MISLITVSPIVAAVRLWWTVFVNGGLLRMSIGLSSVHGDVLLLVWDGGVPLNDWMLSDDDAKLSDNDVKSSFCSDFCMS